MYVKYEHPREFKMSAKGDGSDHGSLHVPHFIARQIPQDFRFRLQITDEGILFVPAEDFEIDLDFLDGAKRWS